MILFCWNFEFRSSCLKHFSSVLNFVYFLTITTESNEEIDLLISARGRIIASLTRFENSVNDLI